jgi:hypothetical protein
MSAAKEIAENILSDAQSGSGKWDEVNGPSAEMRQVSESKYEITIPQEYDEDGNETDHVTLITVECGRPA